MVTTSPTRICSTIRTSDQFIIHNSEFIIIYGGFHELMIVQEEGKINEVYREGNIWYNTVQQSSMEEEKQ